MLSVLQRHSSTVSSNSLCVSSRDPAKTGGLRSTASSGTTEKLRLGLEILNYPKRSLSSVRFWRIGSLRFLSLTPVAQSCC